MDYPEKTNTVTLEQNILTLGFQKNRNNQNTQGILNEKEIEI